MELAPQMYPMHTPFPRVRARVRRPGGSPCLLRLGRARRWRRTPPASVLGAVRSLSLPPPVSRETASRGRPQVGVLEVWGPSLGGVPEEPDRRAKWCRCVQRCPEVIGLVLCACMSEFGVFLLMKWMSPRGFVKSGLVLTTHLLTALLALHSVTKRYTT